MVKEEADIERIRNSGRFLSAFTGPEGKTLLFCFVLVLAGSCLPSRFAVALTPSVEYRLFFLERGPQQVEKGDFVYMDGLSSRYVKNGTPFSVIKEVGCDEGDFLDVKNREYFCNGDFLVKAKSITLKGEKIANFQFSGRVPAGFMFLIGRHKDSFDSRYLGFFKKADIVALAHPIF